MKNPFTEFFKKRSEKKARIKAKTENLIKSYEVLIQEYNLIQEKKSKLPLLKRKSVVTRVAHLIAKGHIVINQTT